MDCMVFLILIAITFYPGTGAIQAEMRSRPKMISRAECLSESNLADAIQKLSSGMSDIDLDQVKKLLLGDANQSTICRQRVISAVLRKMNTRPTEQAGFLFWRYGAEILGELKASEAIDHLIAHLDVSDGLSPSMNHYPSARALIKMGTIALPKLTNTLSQSSDRYLRRKAVFCIAQIGGPQAARALKDASRLETDGCNSKFISTSIKAFKNKDFPNQITSRNRAEWYSAFLCHE